MKKHFNKELVMTKEDDEDIENSTKCWIYDNVYVEGDLKVRDHCHITKALHREIAISKLKLIIKILPYSIT